jgi:hypothetical protein
MKQIVFLITAVLVTGLAAQAQDPMITNTQKNGKQVITTIDKVTAPSMAPGQPVGPGQKLLVDASAMPVVLQARDWRCGRAFTDEFNRRWQMVYGMPMNAKPPVVNGWLMRATDQRLYFFSTSGGLFLNVNAAAIATS